MAMGVETGRRAILAIYLYYYHCSSLGHSNRTPSVGWLKPHTLSLTVLETRKYKIKAPADLVSGESLLPGLQMVVFLLNPHMTEN